MKDALGHRINRKRFPLSRYYYMGLAWAMWEAGFDFVHTLKHHKTLPILFSVDIGEGADKSVDVLLHVK